MSRDTANKKRPDPPEDIQDEALLEWHRVCGELEAIGKLATSDRAIISLYCKTWARWQAMSRNVDTFGPVVKFPNGYPGISPHYQVLKDCEAKLARLIVELGITPSQRTSTNKPQPGELEF